MCRWGRGGEEHAYNPPRKALKPWLDPHSPSPQVSPTTSSSRSFFPGVDTSLLRDMQVSARFAPDLGLMHAHTVPGRPGAAPRAAEGGGLHGVRGSDMSARWRAPGARVTPSRARHADAHTPACPQVQLRSKHAPHAAPRLRTHRHHRTPHAGAPLHLLHRAGHQRLPAGCQGARGAQPQGRLHTALPQRAGGPAAGGAGAGRGVRRVRAAA